MWVLEIGACSWQLEGGAAACCVQGGSQARGSSEGDEFEFSETRCGCAMAGQSFCLPCGRAGTHISARVATGEAFFHLSISAQINTGGFAIRFIHKRPRDCK